MVFAAVRTQGREGSGSLRNRSTASQDVNAPASTSVERPLICPYCRNLRCSPSITEHWQAHVSIMAVQDFDSTSDEKKDTRSSQPPRDEASTRLETTNPSVELCNEEEALALVRAHPDSTNPISITFSLNDPENPRNFPSWKKWYITILVSYFNLLASLGASGYSSASVGISETFHVSTEVTTVGLSMFIFGFSIGPVLLAPLSG